MRLVKAMAPCPLRVVPWLLSLAVAGALAGLSAPPLLAQQPVLPTSLPGAVDEQVWRAPVAPGISLVAVRRLDGQGWVDLFALVADLDTPGVGVDVLTGPSLTDRQPTSVMARAAGAVGAINGDFFHLGATGAPAGLVVKSGQLWKSPYPTGRPSVAIVRTAAGLRAYVGDFKLSAALTVVESPAGQPLPVPAVVPVSGLNEPALSPGQVGVYDARWGSAPLPLARWPAGEVAYAVLEALPGQPGRWKVTQVGQGAAPVSPAPERMVLLGWRQGAEALRNGPVRVGAVAVFEARVVPASGAATAAGEGPSAVPPWASGATLWAAVSGGSVILRGGRPVIDANQPGDALARHPRSALGVGRDGRRLVLVAVDGRRATSRGMDVAELALWLQRLGVTDAVNLDGGGSTTLAALVGQQELTVINRPAAGEERAVPVALGLFYGQEPGPMPGAFVLKPALPPEVSPPHVDAYFLGQEGLVAAAGSPTRVTSFPPVDPAALLWAVDPPDLGFFPQPGVFVGLRPGRGRIVALRTDGVPDWAYAHSLFQPPSSGDPVAALVQGALQGRTVAATLPVEVIGRPVALRIAPDPLRLVPETTVRLVAWVLDADGRRAAVDPKEVTFWLRGAAEGTVRDGVLVSARPFRSPEPPVLEARYFGLAASVPIEWVEPDAPAAPAAGTRADGAAAPGGGVAAPADGAKGPGGEAGVRVAVLGSLPPPGGQEPLGRWLAEVRADLVLAIALPAIPGEPFAEAAARLARPGWRVAAALPDGPGAPAAGDFIAAFGPPNAVASRGSARFLILNPSTASWEWVAREIRRAASQQAEGVRHLVVLVPSSPLTWQARREGEMLLGWLALAARAGLGAWVVFGGDAVSHAMVDGVHLLGVPPLSGTGGPVLLTVGPSAIAVATGAPGAAHPAAVAPAATPAPAPASSAPAPAPAEG